MADSAFPRFIRSAGELGTLNAVIVGLNRVLKRFGRFPMSVERAYLVVQPIPPPNAILTGHRGKSIVVRTLSSWHKDPQLLQFRLARTLDFREQQGVVTLVAYRAEGKAALGAIWLTLSAFQEGDRSTKLIPYSGHSLAIDVDVYVHPAYRHTPAFAKLWDAAKEWLRERGVCGTISKIMCQNMASLQAHRRLGARVFGSIISLVFGSLRVTVSSRKLAPRLFVSSDPSAVPTFRLKRDMVRPFFDESCF